PRRLRPLLHHDHAVAEQEGEDAQEPAGHEHVDEQLGGRVPPLGPAGQAPPQDFQRRAEKPHIDQQYAEHGRAADDVKRMDALLGRGSYHVESPSLSVVLAARRRLPVVRMWLRSGRRVPSSEETVLVGRPATEGRPGLEVANMAKSDIAKQTAAQEPGHTARPSGAAAAKTARAAKSAKTERTAEGGPGQAPAASPA